MDPYRKTLRFANTLPLPVQTGLTDAASIYWKLYIQNNLDESWNSVLREIVVLKGPHDLPLLLQRIQATAWSWNNPQELDLSQLKHKYSSKSVLGHTLLSIPRTHKSSIQTRIYDKRNKDKKGIIRN